MPTPTIRPNATKSPSGGRNGKAERSEEPQGSFLYLDSRNNSTFSVPEGERARETPGEKGTSDAFERAKVTRGKLLKRLETEDADDLTQRFRLCGTPYELVCMCCGRSAEVERRCSKKWCPVCARKIAAKRSAKWEKAVSLMKWPLFVTLTMRNVDDLSHDAVRTLRRAFGKLRHRKLWKERVTGGIASIEVTNIGNGWHPHLHAVLDCEWLAFKTPKPKQQDSREKKKKLCQEAAKELERAWAQILKQKTASVKVKRTSDSMVTKEVLKYSVKGSDLLESPDPIAPLLRCLEATRLVTTFGSLFGCKPDDDELEARPGMICPCGAVGEWVPEELAERIRLGVGNPHAAHRLR